MQIKYTGEHEILLMHEGKVWRVKSGDTIPDVSSVPELPNFEAVAEATKATKKGVSE